MTTEGSHRFFHVWKRRLRGIQLQHKTSPLDVTKFYILNLRKDCISEILIAFFKCGSIYLFTHVFVYPVFLDATPQLSMTIKEEVTSAAGSEHGEEEMEVDSTEEHEEEGKSQGGQTHSQVAKSNNTGSSFNTLSSLGSLKPGITCLFSVLTIITGTFLSASSASTTVYTQKDGCVRDGVMFITSEREPS